MDESPKDVIIALKLAPTFEKISGLAQGYEKWFSKAEAMLE